MYKLINQATGEEHICSKIEIDGIDYYLSDEIIKDVRPYYGKWQIEEGTILNKFPTYLTDLSSCRLVIATNNPNIDIPNIIEDEEDIKECFALSILKQQNWDTSTNLPFNNGFIKGYNKSQETHPNSDEDMVDFLNWSKEYYESDTDKFLLDNSPDANKSVKELLDIWKEQKLKIVYYN